MSDGDVFAGRRIAGEIPEAPQESTELVLFEVRFFVFLASPPLSRAQRVKSTYVGTHVAVRHAGDEPGDVTGTTLRAMAEGETYPWLSGGTTPEHQGRTASYTCASG